MDRTGEEKLLSTIRELKSYRDWLDEVQAMSSVLDQLDEMKKKVSIRDLATMLNRTKTWVGVTLVLVRGLRVYPEMEKFHNRNQAYSFLKEKQKRIHGYRN